jgi:hypothetical protein
MAASLQDELYRNFLEIAGQQASALSDVTGTLNDVAAQVRGGNAAMPAANDSHEATSSDDQMMLTDVLAQVQEVRSNEPPPNTRTTGSTSGSSNNSGEGTLASVASTVLKSGFGLAPLITGLVSLFGGDDTPAPAPLVKYALPPAIDFEAAETAYGVGGLDYDQAGMARVYRAGPAADTAAASVNGAGASASGGAAPQITVNVQAMDARSFLDRSNDIALAVRDAMLNMNAINDVVGEL